MTDTEDNFKDYLWEKRHKALYKAELSALYHQKRERFFELWDKLSKVASVFGGSAALYKATDPSIVGKIAICITAMSALSLVFSFSERSKRHSELARNFKQLIASIISKGEIKLSKQDIYSWDTEIARLETGEPPSLSLLVVLCQNEIAVAQGQPQKVVPINFFKRQLANFIDIAAPST